MENGIVHSKKHKKVESIILNFSRHVPGLEKELDDE